MTCFVQNSSFFFVWKIIGSSKCNQVLSKYIHKLGVSPLWSLTDVFGLEPDQLEWMPKPVKAVILLFPDSVSKDLDKFNENGY